MITFVVHGIPGSPYVRKALLGLEEKGMPWRLDAIGFGEHKSAAWLARQPFGRIPAFTHGDFAFYETQAMLRYIDRIVPAPPLTPADARAEARMNQLCGIADCYVTREISAAVSFPRLMAPRFGMPVDEAAVVAALPGAERCVAEVARLMGAGPFMAGDALSLADLMLAPHFDYFATTQEGGAMLARHAALAGWLARMRARPSMAATAWERIERRAAA